MITNMEDARRERMEKSALLERSTLQEKVDLVIDMQAEYCIYEFTAGYRQCPMPEAVRALAELIRARNEMVRLDTQDTTGTVDAESAS